MENQHLLKTEQMLVIDNQIVHWKPAKEGEKLFGDPFIGCAEDFGHRGRIVRWIEQIKSVEPVTAEDIERFEEARKGHNEVMREYYDKNSYTGD